MPCFRAVEFSETQRIDDQGPAPQQFDDGETDSTDDSTVSEIILPEPGVNVQAQVEAALQDVVTEPREGEAEAVQRNVQQPLADHRHNTSIRIYHSLFF